MGGGEKYHKSRGAIKTALSEASEDMREIKKTPVQTNKMTMPIRHSQARKTPRAEATPLPPCKRKNKEKTWPMTPATPAAAMTVAGKSAIYAQVMGIAPFPMSAINVRGGGRFFTATHQIGDADIFGAVGARVGQAKQAGKEQ